MKGRRCLGLNTGDLNVQRASVELRPQNPRYKAIAVARMDICVTAHRKQRIDKGNFLLGLVVIMKFGLNHGGKDEEASGNAVRSSLISLCRDYDTHHKGKITVKDCTIAQQPALYPNIITASPSQAPHPYSSTSRHHHIYPSDNTDHTIRSLSSCILPKKHVSTVQ